MMRKTLGWSCAFALGILLHFNVGIASATPLGPAVYSISDYGAGTNDHGVWFRRFDSTNSVDRYTFTSGQFAVSGNMAQLTGNIVEKGNASRGFDINMVFSKVPDATAATLDGKCEQGGCDTSGWHYFNLTMGMFTGVGDLLGLDLNLLQIPTDGSYPWQVGVGANSKNFIFGGAMWFEWEVKQNTSGVSVCTSSLNCGSDYHGDFNVNLALIPGITPSFDMPEPATLGLFALGLVGLGGLAYRRQRRSA